ncbi:penicillin binding protein PBP4B [Neobacillus bataviensis]|uniref:penicillin binding protein PBP4B n=1 Tax=Neobacillus bataviensis TaxID=220685 RepID=UPI0029588D06|nr:penicillin binding protein PBP4B [Neobacillus bataviensis]
MKQARYKDTFPVLSMVKHPEEVGFSSEKLKQVDEWIQEDVDNGFPGAVLLIIKDGKIVKNTAYGYAKKYDGQTPMSHAEHMKADTMFDLASNTKMYATNFALQKLVSEGKIDLDARVQQYIPEFKDESGARIKGKDTLRLIDILHHSAGFPADPQYHNPTAAGKLYSQDRVKTLKMLSKTPLQYEPGTKNIYSDVDYMLLGYIVEKVTGQLLDDYVENNIYKPLGLMHTMFNPLQKGFKQKDFAATELMGNTRDGVINFPNMRTYTLQGEVHDEKAFYSMDGISGHAGLFSTTDDLAVLLQVMLNGGGYGVVKVFDQHTIHTFVRPSTTNPTYGLGWRRNGNSSMKWMFGPHASETAVGHTGWTGTVTIIDFEQNLGIALLTNKKHSSVIDPIKDPNTFAGDAFNTGKYGSVVTGIYEALIAAPS